MLGRMLEIEDLSEDVIGKAMRGLGMDAAAVAKKAGLEQGAVDALLEGGSDEKALRRVAEALELSPGALVELNRGAWKPEPREVPGIKRFTTEFGGDMQVNAYMVWDVNTSEAVVFDTGTDCGPILDTVGQKGLKVGAILLTHTHPDHVADLERLQAGTGAPVYVPKGESAPGATPFEPGKTFVCGQLDIRSYLTSGHSPAGTTYVVHGLKRPVAIVGDAIFCASIGGPNISYEDALSLIRKHIFSLPDPAVLCPGHGPVTTVGEEKSHNPFFPEFKN